MEVRKYQDDNRQLKIELSETKQIANDYINNWKLLNQEY